MNVLHLIRALDPIHGGPQEGLRQYCLAAGRAGHHFEVATLDAPGDACLRNYPAVTHAFGPGGLGYGYTPRLAPWLRANAGRYDAVVVHGLWNFHALAARRPLLAAGAPYFVFPHGMLDPWFKKTYPLKHLKKSLYWPWSEYPLLRDARAVLFTTQEEARLAPASFSRYRARPVVVGFGIGIDAAQRDAAADVFLDAFPRARGKRCVLFLSRLSQKKGCDLLIDAFAGVARQDPDLLLVMAGPDREGWRAALEARVAALGLTDRVLFTGMLGPDLKWSALRAAEAFVLPSHQENFGVAVVEALALGVPVLISDQVNIWREIDAAGAGLVAPDTPAGTADLLRRWLAMDGAARRLMADRARACYRAHFHIDTTTAQLMEAISRYGSRSHAPA